MKLYKYTAMAMSGNIDPYIVYNNLSKHYDNISYYNPFNKNYVGKKGDPAVNPIDGVKIDKLFSGRTVTKQDGVKCEFGLDINIEIFSERCVVMQELIFDFKDKQAFDVMIKKINFQYMLEEVLSWDTDTDKVDSSIISFMNTFIMKKLLPFFTDERLKKIFHDMDPTEKRHALGYRQKIKEMIGYNVDICGGAGSNSTSTEFGTGVILDEKEEIKIDDSLEKYSTDRELYHSKSLDAYICYDKKVHKDFLFAYRNYNLYSMILKGYRSSLEMWSDAINKEAEDLITNLDNQNEVFWKELRLRIEEWQLHFLSQNTHRIKAISRIKSTNLLSFSILNDDKKKPWKDYIQSREKRMQRFVSDIRYGLDNIATPGHTHDEQRLQEESETTNERILLLSFLAMSIPMLGAIFSPAFSLNTKIISATVLVSLPVLYFSIFRLSKKRQRTLAKREDFHRKKSAIQQWVEYHTNNIEEYKNDAKIADDVKQNIISWEEENIAIGQNMIAKIDKKLK